MNQKQEHKTTLWHNIKARVKFIQDTDLLFGDGVEWAKAIVEEMERIYEKLAQNENLINIVRGQLIQDAKEKLAQANPQEGLKPCPLCDREVQYYERISREYTPTRAIICICGVSLEIKRNEITKRDLITYWNRGNA